MPYRCSHCHNMYVCGACMYVCMYMYMYMYIYIYIYIYKYTYIHMSHILYIYYTYIVDIFLRTYQTLEQTGAVAPRSQVAPTFTCTCSPRTSEDRLQVFRTAESTLKGSGLLEGSPKRGPKVRFTGYD